VGGGGGGGKGKIGFDCAAGVWTPDSYIHSAADKAIPIHILYSEYENYTSSCIIQVWVTHSYISLKSTISTQINFATYPVKL